MTQAIYRLNGEYFGFIWQARFFDKDSNYIGWVDGKEVWTTENEYLGEILDDKHIVRYTKATSHPLCQGKCPPPITPVKTENCSSIEARPAKKDYIDALDDYKN
jgi:hypothetical protein